MKTLNEFINEKKAVLMDQFRSDKQLDLGAGYIMYYSKPDRDGAFYQIKLNGKKIGSVEYDYESSAYWVHIKSWKIKKTGFDKLEDFVAEFKATMGKT